jgi:transposase-like protein
MEKTRRHYTAEEKVVILKRHFVEGVEVSTLCDEYKIHPTLFYRWQKDLFENAVSLFERTDRKESRLEMQNKALREKLGRKDEVLAELMEEHVKLKKSLGEI